MRLLRRVIAHPEVAKPAEPDCTGATNPRGAPLRARRLQRPFTYPMISRRAAAFRLQCAAGLAESTATGTEAGISLGHEGASLVRPHRTAQPPLPCVGLACSARQIEFPLFCMPMCRMAIPTHGRPKLLRLDTSEIQPIDSIRSSEKTRVRPVQPMYRSIRC